MYEEHIQHESTKSITAYPSLLCKFSSSCSPSCCLNLVQSNFDFSFKSGKYARIIVIVQAEKTKAMFRVIFLGTVCCQNGVVENLPMCSSLVSC